jgi:DNA-binding Xre family transcriptional regulator
LDKLRRMLKAMGKQKKMNVKDVAAKMGLKSNLNLNSLNSKNEDYDKIVLDNYLLHIIKVWY